MFPRRSRPRLRFLSLCPALELGLPPGVPRNGAGVPQGQNRGFLENPERPGGKRAVFFPPQLPRDNGGPNLDLKYEKEKNGTGNRRGWWEPVASAGQSFRPDLKKGKIEGGHQAREQRVDD